MLFAGFLRGAGVDLVQCRTVDLQVPAAAEIVIEGYVDTGDLRTEGPFGDHTGYYSLADDYPTLHVTAITHRREPIYQTIVVGRPPMEDTWLGKATERIFLPFIQMMLPEVLDVNFPEFGVFHNFVMVRIKKQYPLHAHKVMHAVWGLGQLALTKFVVVVDEDVDVQDEQRVLWTMVNCVDPRRDVCIVDGPVDVLDHAAPLARAGSKMGFDATRKWPEEGHPREWPEPLAMPEELRARVSERWSELGIPLPPLPPLDNPYR
jgi:4-hydroxy-3-polyprenylbenzoate decarboxylase